MAHLAGARVAVRWVTVSNPHARKWAYRVPLMLESRPRLSWDGQRNDRCDAWRAFPFHRAKHPRELSHQLCANRVRKVVQRGDGVFGRSRVASAPHHRLLVAPLVDKRLCPACRATVLDCQVRDKSVSLCDWVK